VSIEARICVASAVADARNTGITAMLDRWSNRRWYGVLETSQARTSVVFDPKVQPAPSGQVYLYNMDRDAIVAYDWSIVSERLKDVDATEAAAIKRLIGVKLAAARKQHWASRGRRTPQMQARPRQASTPLADFEDDPWGEVFLEDMVAG
jgi:hypothetical protein